MTVLVTDKGFGPDDFLSAGGVFVQLDDLRDKAQANADEFFAVDLPQDRAASELAQYLDRINLIRIPFPNFGDGRGFGLAAALRRMGYRGRLRAVGHVINEQYRHARRSGFDEVELSAEQAKRQPEENWALDTVKIEGYQEHFGTLLQASRLPDIDAADVAA